MKPTPCKNEMRMRWGILPGYGHATTCTDVFFNWKKNTAVPTVTPFAPLLLPWNKKIFNNVRFGSWFQALFLFLSWFCCKCLVFTLPFLVLWTWEVCFGDFVTDGEMCRGVVGEIVGWAMLRWCCLFISAGWWRCNVLIFHSSKKRISKREEMISAG